MKREKATLTSKERGRTRDMLLPVLMCALGCGMVFCSMYVLQDDRFPLPPVPFYREPGFFLAIVALVTLLVGAFIYGTPRVPIGLRVTVITMLLAVAGIVGWWNGQVDFQSTPWIISFMINFIGFPAMVGVAYTSLLLHWTDM